MPSSPHPFALVTGTSSGIGEALARELLARGWRVVGVSRRVAPIADPGYTHLQLDLGELAALASSLDNRLAPLVADPAVTRLGLVNNAAMEALLGTYGNTKAALRMAGMVFAAELDAAASAAPGHPDTTVLSFEPGIVDTPMQALVRNSSAEILPSVQMFKEFAAA